MATRRWASLASIGAAPTALPTEPNRPQFNGLCWGYKSTVITRMPTSDDE